MEATQSSLLILGLTVPVGDLATWFGSLVVGLTFVVAGFQIVTDILRRRREEIFQQAKGVSAWIEEEDMKGAWIAVNNTSEAPVYGAIVAVVAFQGAGPQTGKETPSDLRGLLSVIPPGKSFTRIGFIGRGMHFHPGIEIAFTDRSGRHWVRDGHGELNQISKEPIDHYGLSKPQGWSMPVDHI